MGAANIPILMSESSSLSLISVTKQKASIFLRKQSSTNTRRIHGLQAGQLLCIAHTSNVEKAGAHRSAVILPSFSVAVVHKLCKLQSFRRPCRRSKPVQVHSSRSDGEDCSICTHSLPVGMKGTSCSIVCLGRIWNLIAMAAANNILILMKKSSSLLLISVTKQKVSIFERKQSSNITRRIYGMQAGQLLCIAHTSNVEEAGAHRSAVILPGLGKSSRDYQLLASSLEAKGVRTFIAKISKLDWLRYTAGLLDRNFWKGTLCPRPLLDWYLIRTKEAVYEAKLVANGGKISLIGHSIGGWIARVYLGEFGMDDISTVLTLGTPHRPPPKGVSGVIDQTRGLLDYVDKYCPVVNHESMVKYLCIAGRYMKGECLVKMPKIKISDMESIAGVNDNILITSRHKDNHYMNKDMNDDSMGRLTSSKLNARIVGQGYKQVCGRADVWGDGVVPVISSHLKGATNITLEGVYHSPNRLSDISKPWYGSNTIVDKWVHHLLY